MFLRLCGDLSETDFQIASTIAQDVRTEDVVGECLEVTELVKLRNKFSVVFSVLLEFH